MAVPNQTPASVASDYATIQFIMQQLMAGLATATIVQVVSCTNDGGLSAVGSVDVRPLVNMMTGDRTAVPHGILHKLPYTRLQGGTNAVIIDPEPGDLGIAVFASRDISAVKANKARANPGSNRQFNMADGMYIGGLLNGTPVQFVQFSPDGVKVKSPAAITLEAPQINFKGAVTQTDGDASFAQNVAVGDSLTAQVEVTAGDIGLTTHKHPTAPLGPVSPPIP